MKKLILLSLMLTPVLAFAQDAGTAALDGGVAVATSVDPSAVVNDATPMIKVVYTAVAHGDWWAAAAAFLVLVVALIRKYGLVVYAKLKPTNPLDKVLFFILKTTPGGWILNQLTAISGGVGTALMAGEKLSWAIVKPILMVSITGASLWELVKDVRDYVAGMKAAAPTPVGAIGTGGAAPATQGAPSAAPPAAPPANPPAA